METEYMNLSLMEDTGNESSGIPESTDYDLQSFSYNIKREVSQSLNSTSLSKIGVIKVVMSSFPSDQLVRWAFDAGKHLYGLINIRKDKNTIPHESILVTRARCTRLILHYKLDRNDEIQLALDILPETMTVHGEEITNN